MATLMQVKVPDIGDFHDIPVIEVMVKVGDSVRPEDGLITLESDKATMEVPSPAAGVVKEVMLKVGDKVEVGALVLLLDTGAGELAPATGAAPPAAAAAAPTPASAAIEAASPPPPNLPVAPPPPTAEAVTSVSAAAATATATATNANAPAHASPGVRAFARELGVAIAKVAGSGPKQRILREDVQNYVKARLSAPHSEAAAAGGGLDLLPWPKIDFAKFGPVEAVALSRIQKISGANLSRNWVMIPHVTQFESADITDLEAFRQTLNREHADAKLTLLAFLIKAVVVALKQYPNFNASLTGEQLILKRYFHIGFAADTPNGLVVPVIRDADAKGVRGIALEMGELARKAREGKLLPAEMQGGCFSIS